ncbi:MAG: YjjG family noncanonical pyrimidine nucleotidase [Deltaproteobacteria bacterium]|nr:YjjG family noncanonical pyrimidine nucleotidase [Deltaproteobacteria bacterium]
MKYPYLLFDADGTLFDYEQAERLALSKTLEDSGIACSRSCHLYYNQINKKLFKELEQGTIKASELKTRRFEMLFAEIGISLDVNPFSERYLANLSQYAMLLPGALDTVRSLYPKFKMYMVTNGLSRVQRPRFGRSDIRAFFIDIIISDEIGVSKPAKGFFDIAFQMIGNPDKKDVLIIGDSLSADMAGGVVFGIDTCWYNPHQANNENDLPVSYEISELRQLVDIVKSA